MTQQQFRCILEEAVAAFVDQLGYADPSWINSGSCDEFAEAVCRMVPEAKAIWEDLRSGEEWGSHCFVKYEGKFYDSECLDGVSDWMSLPFFLRMRRDVVEIK
jgi:hypothetical protein